MAENLPHKAMSQAQFESLFKLHFQFLCNYARQYVGDMDAAEEITQNVFIKLWEKREEIDPEKSVRAYLFRSVKNRCLNYLRDNKKYQSQLLDIDCGDFDLGVEEDHFAETELQANIEAALATLPEKCRLVFEMSRYQDKKYKEIAEELDISQKTVEAHMSKAIKTLREYLKHFLVVLWVILSFTIKNFSEEKDPVRGQMLVEMNFVNQIPSRFCVDTTQKREERGGNARISTNISSLTGCESPDSLLWKRPNRLCSFIIKKISFLTKGKSPVWVV
ncbi:MAG: RNA polymerase sigma-70 factor [Bacteroidia bacterium]